MSDFAHRIEAEFKEAFPVKNEGALRRAVAMLSENVVDRPTYSRDIADLRSDVRVIAETMKQGFERVDKRFEDVNARFEQVDRRFEDMNARFEDMHREMDRRFEHVDKRFEDMHRGMDRRFGLMQWSIGVGFTLLVVLMSVYEFIA